MAVSSARPAEGNGKPLLYFAKIIMEVHSNQTKNNSVNGINSSRSDPSLGRDNHEEQVVPDRHPATVHNRDAIQIGSWNVRTLYQPGKLENVKQSKRWIA